MKIGLTVLNGMMAPCFSGVDIWVATHEIREDISVIKTNNWPLYSWTHELSKRDVNILLCSGIDQFLWGALNGYGIRVIANIAGNPEIVTEKWRSGTLQLPNAQNYNYLGRGRGNGRMMRFRQGRGRKK
jgi:predicted Fe-Mo cluster-binding NifX family protein